MQAGVGEVENFLAQQGLNANVIVDGAKKATDTASEALTSAKPVVDSTVSTLSSTSPVVLGEYALGLLALYYLVRLCHDPEQRVLPVIKITFIHCSVDGSVQQGPGIIKGVFGSFRGYAGNITAAGALDAVSNDGNTIIIDIRWLLGGMLAVFKLHHAKNSKCECIVI
jgi:hypothetical protein